MRMTWSFYQKGEPIITLEVIYVPGLDKFKLKNYGFLDAERNKAYVDWSGFKLFDSEQSEIGARREVFQKLTRLSKGGGVQIENEVIRFGPFNEIQEEQTSYRVDGVLVEPAELVLLQNIQSPFIPDGLYVRGKEITANGERPTTEFLE